MAELKMKLIAEYEGVEIDEVTHEYKNVFNVNGNEYLIVDEDEKQEALQEEIKNSAWAFNPNFLEETTGFDSEIFELMQDKCESANDAILKLIESTCGIEKFIETAIQWDGAGHFLAHYDHVEIELDNDLYAYKR